MTYQIQALCFFALTPQQLYDARIIIFISHEETEPQRNEFVKPMEQS